MDRSQRIGLLITTALLLAQLVALMNGVDGRIAADYGYFLPRLVDGLLFHRAAGWSTPWYTASYCGGLPFFPDVQSMFYSLPQLLTLWLDAWTAARLSAVLLIVIGALAFAAFAVRVLCLSRQCSALVFLAFLGNGYYQARVLAGHMTHEAVALIPAVAYLLTEIAIGDVAGGLLSGCVVAAMVHLGFHYGLLLIPPALLLLLLLAERRAREDGQSCAVRIFRRASLAFLVASGLSAGKLAAAWALYSHSSAPPADEFAGPTEIVDGLRLVASQLFLFGAVEPGTWPSYELDCMVNPIIFIGLILALPRMRFSRATAAIDLLIGILIVVCVVFASGMFGSTELLQNISLMRSFRVHQRLASALIAPVIVFGAWGITQYPSPAIRKLLFFAALPLALLPGERLRATVARVADQTYVTDTQDVIQFDALARNSAPDGAVVASVGVALANVPTEAQQRAADGRLRLPGVPNVQDLSSRLHRETNPTCYFPLFDHYPYELVPGAVALQPDQAFNLVNPACYVYPAENHCRPGDRILASDASDMRAMLRYEPTSWQTSELQAAAQTFTRWSAFVVALCLAGLFARFVWVAGRSRLCR